jgi:hypothetical protein
MKRDLELIREILFALEQKDDSIRVLEDQFPDRDPNKYYYNVWLLHDGGFVNAVDFSSNSGFVWKPVRLTWTGSELLDSIRDPEVWRRTKAGAVKVGGASIEFAWQIAKAYGKQLAKEKLGIEI